MKILSNNNLFDLQDNKYCRRIYEAFLSPRIFVAACWWYVVGKRQRSRNRFRLVFSATSIQGKNLRVGPHICFAQANPSISEREEMLQEVAGWHNPPVISIAMPVYNTDLAQLRDAIQSVKKQIYPHWELCIADDCSTDPAVQEALKEFEESDGRIKVVYRSENGHICRASNSAIDIATGPYIAFMDHDDLLPVHALYYVAREIRQYPEADFIYSDEDKIRKEGWLTDPHFKPDWNLELFLTQNYINHLSVYRASIVRDVGGFRSGFEGSQDHDLALRVVARIDEKNIRHIPKILYHWRCFSGSGSFSDRWMQQAIEARQRAVREYFKDNYPDAPVSVTNGPSACNRIVRELPSPVPHVTIIIPTRDCTEFVKACVFSLFDKTDYPSFDVIIVDNDSVEVELKEYLAEITEKHPVTVLPYSGEFNYSAMNNFAVEHASGSVVVLLNNDTQVISSEWLREMVSYAVLPHIGAVGAKLLYANGLVQHAGVIVGVGGIANHAFQFYQGGDIGYQNRLQLPQYFLAVTAACMVVEKDKYLKCGGLDDIDLKVAYNDVDFCLRLSRDFGLKNVYTPYAQLFHHESVSRGQDTSPEKIARFEHESMTMRQRWGDIMQRDPYYNENFSHHNAYFQYNVS